MFDLSMSNVLSGIVGLFFIVGAVVNWIARPKIASDYARWGYPTFFHYVTAVIEGIVAVSVLIPSTRILGAILGALVMVAAGATLVRHKEYRQAIAPALFFIACIAVIVVNWNGS